LLAEYGPPCRVRRVGLQQSCAEGAAAGRFRDYRQSQQARRGRRALKSALSWPHTRGRAAATAPAASQGAARVGQPEGRRPPSPRSGRARRTRPAPPRSAQTPCPEARHAAHREVAAGGPVGRPPTWPAEAGTRSARVPFQRKSPIRMARATSRTLGGSAANDAELAERGAARSPRAPASGGPASRFGGGEPESFEQARRGRPLPIRSTMKK